MGDEIRRVTQFLFDLSDVLMLFMQTLISAFGMMVMLVLAAIVEFGRARNGIALFDTHPGIAEMGAIMLVIINLSIEFQIYHQSLKDKHSGNNSQKEAHKRYKPSLRLYWRSMLYFAGIGGGWKPKETANVMPFRFGAVLISATIMLLSLLGSMGDSIKSVGAVSWSQGIEHILTQSTLSEFAEWVGVIFFTFAAVVTARISTRYIADRVDNVRRDLDKRSGKNRHPVSVERARPEWGQRGDGIAPIKHMVKGKRMYRCPVCGKDMSRQAWSKHGCRFTPELTSVDGGVDRLELVDVRQPVNQGVNHVNHGQ